jgi:DNA-binding LytR/AlgR family response regulator
MRKMSCIIIDDEPVARKVLQEFIAQVPWLVLAAQLESVSRTEAFLRQYKPDLLFLDIEMPKTNGLEFLKSCAVQPPTILTTAYPEYALESYDLDIIDYLLKPIAFGRFVKAVERAREWVELKGAGGAAGGLSAGDGRGPAGAREAVPYLFVRTQRRIEKIETGDISYIESIGNYVNIFMGAKKITAYLTLKGVEQQLPAPQFVKVHQSYLVNFARIESIEGNQVIVRGQALPLGRNFKEALMRMVEERMLRR